MIQRLDQALLLLRTKAPEEPDSSSHRHLCLDPPSPPAKVTERRYCSLEVGVVPPASSAALSPASSTPPSSPAPTSPPAESPKGSTLAWGWVWFSHCHLLCHLLPSRQLHPQHHLRLDCPHLQLGSPKGSTLWGGWCPSTATSCICLECSDLHRLGQPR